MATNKEFAPDINSIISGLPVADANRKPEADGDAEDGSKGKKETSEQTPKDEEAADLWGDFLEFLNNPDKDTVNTGTRKYSLDQDIVDTLQQCEFGKPNVEVVNAILRAFLVNHIDKLVPLIKPKAITIIDRYNS